MRLRVIFSLVVCSIVILSCNSTGHNKNENLLQNKNGNNLTSDSLSAIPDPDPILENPYEIKFNPNKFKGKAKHKGLIGLKIEIDEKATIKNFTVEKLIIIEKLNGDTVCNYPVQSKSLQSKYGLVFIQYCKDFLSTIEINKTGRPNKINIMYFVIKY